MRVSAIRFNVPWLLLLTCLSLIATTYAEDQTNSATQPTIVATLKSVNEILDDADFIGTTVGQEGLKAQVEGALDGITRGMGLAGIDRRRPFGLYWNLRSADLANLGQPVVFVPITDAVALKRLITSLVPNLEDVNGNWTVRIGQITAFAKIANKHCFISLSADELNIPASPEKLVNGNYDVALNVNLANVPDQWKLAFLADLDNQRQNSIQNRPPFSSEFEAKCEQFGYDWAHAALSALTMDGDRMTLGFEVNRKSGMTGIDFNLTGKPDTILGKAFDEFGKLTPAFSIATSELAPLRLLLSYPTSGIVANFNELIEVMEQQADAGIEKDENLDDEAEKKAAKDVGHRLFELAGSTVKSGSMHSFLMLEPAADNTVRVVAGTRMPRGTDASQLLDDLMKMAKESPDAGKIKLDVANFAGARIHEIGNLANGNLAATLGDAPAHLAIREDSLWFAIGGNNLDGLKRTLVQEGVTPGKTSAPISLRTKPATLVTLLEQNDQRLIQRAAVIAGKAGDVFNVELLPASPGIKLRVEFGIDLLQVFGGR